MGELEARRSMEEGLGNRGRSDEPDARYGRARGRLEASRYEDLDPRELESSRFGYSERGYDRGSRPNFWERDEYSHARFPASPNHDEFQRSHADSRYGSGPGEARSRRDPPLPPEAGSDWRTFEASRGPSEARSGRSSNERGFSGRGPKGYARSDERIHEDVCECLMDDPELDASEIEVQVSNGEVTLSGSVSSRWLKRRAEDLVHPIRGVHDVHNQLKAQRRGSSSSSTSAEPGRSGNGGI